MCRDCLGKTDRASKYGQVLAYKKDQVMCK